MGRQKRSFTRKSGFRDSKLIVIATEGVKTEKKYFSDISTHFKNSRIHVEVLIRDDDSLSSPEHILEELNKFYSEYGLSDDLG